MTPDESKNGKHENDANGHNYELPYIASSPSAVLPNLAWKNEPKKDQSGVGN